MAVTFQDTGDLKTATGNLTFVASELGTISDGDILVAFVGSPASEVAAISGFTQKLSYDASNFGGHCTVLWKRASSESGNYATTGLSGASFGFMMRFAGAKASGDPINQATVTDTSNGTTSKTTSTLTPSVNDCLMVQVHINAADTTTGTYSNSGTGLTWTERFDQLESSTFFVSAAAATAPQTTAAAITMTGVLGTGAYNFPIALALEPAATSSVAQAAYRTGNDDGNEASYTQDAQNTGKTIALGVNAIVRFLVQATGDPAAFSPGFEYNLDDGPWFDLAVGSGSKTGTINNQPIAAGADDAQQSGSTVTVTGTTIGASLDATTEYVGLRFDPVNIPKGATITTAYVRVVPSGTGEDEPLVTIAGLDEDDTAQFTTGSNNITARAVTTATAAWDSSNLGADGATYFNTPSLVAIVQEIIDRAGWAPGNAVGFRIQGGATSTRDLTIEAFENAGANPPQLYIEYSYTPPIYIATSANIAASGATATTQRMTGGSGTFQAGTIGDDLNPLPSLNLGDGYNSEVAICARAQSPAVAADVFKIRIKSLNTYTVAAAQLTIASGTSITAAVDALTITERQATVKLSRAVSAALDALVISEQPASIKLSKAIAAAIDALLITEQAAVVGLTTDIAASFDSLTISEQQAIVELGIDIAAGTDALTISEQVATIALARHVAASFDALTITEQPAQVGVATDITAGLDTLTITELAAVLTVSKAVAATVDALIITEHQADIQSASGINAGMDALLITEYPAAVNREVNVGAALDALVLTEFGASITLAKVVAAGLDSLLITEQLAAVSLSRHIAAALDALVITEYPAAVSHSSEIAAAFDQLVIVEHAANVSLARVIAAGFDALTITERQAVIELARNISAGVDALVISEQAAIVELSKAVLAGLDALEITEYPATVEGTAAIILSLARRFVARAPQGSFEAQAPDSQFRARAPRGTFRLH